jgi:ABC-2 family transporter protein
MSWLAWRQARAQTLAALAAVLVVAGAAFIDGRTSTMLRMWLSVLVVVVPGLLGAFWGAPLVAAELESGSFRLAWTQDVSRERWLARRLAVSGLAGMAVAGLLSWLVTCWAGPLDRAGLDQFGSFDSRGIVPVGYAAFAFALGVLFGVLLRRTVPAMAATLVVFTATRIAFRLLARPVLLPPATRALALDPATTGYGSSGFLPFAPPSSLQPAAPDLPNAWVTSIGIVNGKGDALTGGVLARTCPDLGHGRGGGIINPFAHGSSHVPVPPGPVNATQACVARLAATYHELVTYQPASRYWPLQWYELAVFLAAALLLSAACAWRLRRLG